jgi:2,4-diaminopentanoate dehydrogenase
MIRIVTRRRPVERGSNVARKRVIAWGTGPIGLPALRALIDHPEYELVGLHAWSPGKIGRDAGDIAGVGSTEIIATDDVDALLELEADCLVYNGNYAQREAECVADVVAFLERGTNLVTPALMDLIAQRFGRRQYVEPIAEACIRGQSSAFCGGTDPGYMTTGHLFSLLSGAGRIDSVSVSEICDLNGYGTYEAIAHWGFNRPLDFRAPMFHDDMGRGWHESTISGIAEYLGVELDEIVHSYETAAVDFDYEATWGTGRAGTIAAVRWTMTGMYKGQPLIFYKKLERTHKDAAQTGNNRCTAPRPGTSCSSPVSPAGSR